MSRRRSPAERPTRTANSPGGQIQARALSSYRANARAGTASLTSVVPPGSAVAAAKAASVRTGRPAWAASGSTYAWTTSRPARGPVLRSVTVKPTSPCGVTRCESAAADRYSHVV